LRFLHASKVASQPTPPALSLNYGDLFKIQYVQNPFPLGPVSFSALASYLECPSCALERKHKNRSKEPKHFTTLRQATLFGKSKPDARLVGTLLHVLVNFLHDPNGPLAKEQQEALHADTYALERFLRHDVLALLQKTGKLKLAMLLDDLCLDETMFYTTLINPILRYQRELASTGAVVLAAAERFQFKLLSTRNTFAGHQDWGGHVTLVGEFDQVRLRHVGNSSMLSGVLAIMEFKKGLGGPMGGASYHTSTEEETCSPTRYAEQAAGPLGFNVTSGNMLPSASHAMQLMIYWLAFQTRWDVFERVAEAKGMIEDIHMPLHQQLDLIIYNLNDGSQYQLLPTSHQEALLALTTCIFHLNWAMKSGYAW
jgi:hypothetical protein